MHLTGTPTQIYEAIERDHPELPAALDCVREYIPWSKRQIDNDREYSPWQSAALFALARQYNRAECRILEIGTALGYSAAVMAEAAPTAIITTLNPKEKEYPRAVENLVSYVNVFVVNLKSWDLLEAAPGFSTGTYQYQLDMVFVDGDHGQVERDLPWWEFLREGGLMLFHDYAPEGSARPCQPVYDAVNEFGTSLGREPDVLVMDDRGVGLAGFYKREGE